MNLKGVSIVFFLLLLLLQGCGSGGGGKMAEPVIADINGALVGSGAVGSLFVINGENFGDLSASSSGYSVDFRDLATDAVVASAQVDFQNGGWKDTFIKATVPNLDVSTTYKVTVITPGGTSNSVNFLILASVSFSPSTIAWTSTSSLPVAQQGFPTVIAAIGTESYIYAIGGNTATGSTPNGKASSVDTVYLNRMDSATGALANAVWSSTTPLPDSRGFAAAVIANRFNSKVGGNGALYVLGGLDGAGSPTSTVYRALLDPDGTVPESGDGAWTEATALPQSLSSAQAVISHGRIYVVGGNNPTGTPVSTAYYARINGDGTLGNWAALPDMPEALAYFQLVTSTDHLYAIGGDSGAVDPVSNVQSPSSIDNIYHNQINLKDGTLVNATWTTQANILGKKREKHTAVVAGSYILLSGGLYNGAPNGSSEQSYAAINTDGSVGSFGGATGSDTISDAAGGYNFFNHSAAYFVDESGNPHILVLGGEDVNTGLPHSEVWYQH